MFLRSDNVAHRALAPIFNRTETEGQQLVLCMTVLKTESYLLSVRKRLSFQMLYPCRILVTAQKSEPAFLPRFFNHMRRV